MSEIRNILLAADENYLIALSNKGLYKRAQRELPEANAAVAWEGEQVSVGFADGTKVVMIGSIQKYTCTCPSRSLCKHVLMAVLAVQASLAAQAAQTGGTTQAGEAGSEAAAAAPDFSALEDLDAWELEKTAGKRVFREAILAVQLGESCTIEEGSTLRIILADSGHSVQFLPGASLTQASCTCKSPSFCAHRAQAVVQYIKSKKIDLPLGYILEETESELDFSGYTLPYIQGFVSDVMRTGLARLPDDVAGRFLQLATLCHSQRLANMERLCRRISGQLVFYRQRSATFARDELISDLCTLLHLCQKIASGGTTKEAVGVFRETYRPVPQMELWALGAYGWQSIGGYRGVTIPFFCPEAGKRYTYTSAMPADLVPSLDRLYHARAPWGLMGSLPGLAGMRISLKGGKVSGKGQLSSSEAGNAILLGSTDSMAPELASLRFDDYEALLEALWLWGEAGEEGPMTVIVIPGQVGDSHYDDIRQEWSLPLYDHRGRRMMIQVRFEKGTQRLLDNLAQIEKEGGLCRPMLVRVFLTGGRLTAFPVTLYTEKPFQLSLDVLKDEKKKTQFKYDWGDSG